jgi:hypothetical protein
MPRLFLLAGPALALAMLGACAGEKPVAEADVTEDEFHPVYLGIETNLMDGDLVDFKVAMQGARNNDDVSDYARCAAAQYALIRGYGFARHVRTNVVETGGTWRADAVYTISAALPRGLKTIDAEVTVRDCGERGIPTV